MKKLSILLLMSLLSLMAFAGPVSRHQAQSIAAKYLQEQRVSRSNGSAGLTLAYECLPKTSKSVGADNTPLYYVFNQGKSEGFVVVAGDDRVNPVLGYVDQGQFAMSNVHDGMRWWLDALEQTMLQVKQTPGDQPMICSANAEGLKASVEPMVKVNWGQGDPYNAKCPMDEAHNARSLVGCTAVAMAQVLSKWQSVPNATGHVEYTTITHKLKISENLEDYPFNWAEMKVNGEPGDLSAAGKESLANLMYACGLAVGMDYCSIASGANLFGTALKDHFNVDSKCTRLYRMYYTKSEWDELIKTELSEGRPVVYNGFSLMAGHAFVCDGYNKDGLFHINWGWDGSLNGYFALAELNSAVEQGGAPSGEEGSFNFDQSAIIGIQPQVGEPQTPETYLYFQTMKLEGTASKSNVSVLVNRLTTDDNGFNGYMALGIFNAQDSLVAIAGEKKEVVAEPLSFNDYILGGALPKNLEEGIYSLRPISLEGDNVESYKVIKARKSSPYVSKLTMVYRASSISILNTRDAMSSISIVNSKMVAEKNYSGALNVIEVTLRNTGALYNGPIVLSREDADRVLIIYSNNYIIDKNEEITLRAKILAPEGVDKDKLGVWMSSNDEDDLYITGFEYKFLGDVSFDLIKTAPGDPDISLVKGEIVDRNIYLGDTIQFHLTVKNEGGFFGQNLHCFVFPEQGGSGLFSGQRTIYIDKGEELTLDVYIPLNELSAGNYMIQPFIDYNSNYIAISSNTFHFSVKDTESISISSNEGYAVYGVKHAFVVPEGLECGVVTSATQDNITIDYRYKAGDVVPRNTPVVVKAERRRPYRYDVVLCSEPTPSDNLLSFNVDEKGYTYSSAADVCYYGFVKDNDTKEYGFFFKQPEGAPFKLSKKSCFLAVPKASAKVTGYPFSKAVSTGIENIVLPLEANGDAVIYTLSGVRVNAKFNELPKGIYIVNGKKMIK